MSKNSIIKLKKSQAVIDGKPKLPAATNLSYGEVALNYAKDNETLFIKNNNDEIVTFSSDKKHTYTKGEGEYSAQIGNCMATEDYSVAEGKGTRSFDIASHAEGIGTEASNIASHAEGYETIAAGMGSHAEGLRTESLCDYEHSMGKYNVSRFDGDYTGYPEIGEVISPHGEIGEPIRPSQKFGSSENTLFTVGNGINHVEGGGGIVTHSDDEDDDDESLYGVYKHNAFEIRQNGDIYIADTRMIGQPNKDPEDTSTYQYYNTPMIKLQDVISKRNDGVNINTSDLSHTPTDKKLVYQNIANKNVTFGLTENMTNGDELHVIGIATQDHVITIPNTIYGCKVYTNGKNEEYKLNVSSDISFEINVLFANNIYFIRTS